MTRVLPQFSDPFVEGVANAFRRRMKSLRHHGEVVVRHTGDDEFEIAIRTPNRLWLILAVARHELTIWIRSGASTDRGKKLFALDCIRVVNKPDEIERAFEECRALVGGRREDEALPIDQLTETWSRFRVSAVS
jgi:hypothetical protein